MLSMRRPNGFVGLAALFVLASFAIFLWPRHYSLRGSRIVSWSSVLSTTESQPLKYGHDLHDLDLSFDRPPGDELRFASSATKLPIGSDAPIATSTPSSIAPPRPLPSNFKKEFFTFQNDMPKYKLPNTDFVHFKDHRAHLHRFDRGGATFATYFSSRNASLNEPYFLACLQLIYRSVWDWRSASRLHPFTVFVAPYIVQEQRDIFTAMGAIVRELDLIEWIPNAPVWGRWRDVFSKLHMWNQTEFSRIAFLDIDAFPFSGIDDIFDLATPRFCDRDSLEAADRHHETEICPYIFAGTKVMSVTNVGVMVFNPSESMHIRLMRDYVKADLFDNSMAEQSFLNHMFNDEGAFPITPLPRPYNGNYPIKDENPPLKVVHEKIWFLPDDHFMRDSFEETWNQMKEWYEGPTFKMARYTDNQVVPLKLPAADYQYGYVNESTILAAETISTYQATATATTTTPTSSQEATLTSASSAELIETKQTTSHEAFSTASHEAFSTATHETFSTALNQISASPTSSSRTTLPSLESANDHVTGIASSSDHAA